MGLTIHYQLRLPGSVGKAAAEHLVRAVHRRSAALVRRRELAEITPVQEADLDSFRNCQFVSEERDGTTFGHDVPADCGWVFSVWPGPDCESARFGLCHYPATIKVGRRTLRTGCGGWGYASFCKTQYASLHGAEHFLKCHLAVIDLVLLWQKAGATVKINDEGDYWPGRNKAKLRAECEKMNRLMAAFAGALKDAGDEGGPAVESPIFQHTQFERLEAQGLAENPAKIPCAAKIVSTIAARKR